MNAEDLKDADLIRHEAEMLERRQAKIKEYEKKYGMTSAEFLKKWEEGTAPDTFETNYWANILLRGRQ